MLYQNETKAYKLRRKDLLKTEISNALENNDDLNVSINEIINRDFYYINDDNLLVSDINKLYTYIPIIKNNEFIGLFSLSHNIS